MESTFFRSIWLSDTHLGGRNAQSDKLLQFLLNNESEYLYLVGDILDLWQLKRRWHWSSIEDQIIATLFTKARNGTKVYYLPGNHDELLKPYSGLDFNGISIINEAIHRTANGSSYLVMHGDTLDCIVQKKKWLAEVGSILYCMLLIINRWYNRLRSAFGLSYHSISASIKHRVKKAVNYIGNFEEALTSQAHQNQVDGLICGHIHHATIRDIDGVLYSNAGDWVESCTALAENANGTVGIIQWHDTLPVTETVKKENIVYEDRYRDRCLAPTN